MKKKGYRGYAGGDRKARLWRRSAVFLLLCALIPVFAAHANADYGPKPSVIITAEELPEGIRFGTLLAAAESYGRWHAADRPAGNEKGGAYAGAYNAFLDYAAQDDYYFWGRVFEIEDGTLVWSYYPPEQFKVLLYDPDADMLYAGGETKRYALDSVYRADIHEDGTVTLSSAPYRARIVLSFCSGLLFTVSAEVLTGLLFGYRRKNEILLIIAVNCVTQLCLILFLFLSDRILFERAWFLIFPLLELAVITGEAAVYAARLRSHSKKRAAVYAVLANAVTLLSGVLAAWLL